MTTANTTILRHSDRPTAPAPAPASVFVVPSLLAGAAVASPVPAAAPTLRVGAFTCAGTGVPTPHARENANEGRPV